MKPDITSYNSLITAWGRSKEEGSPERAKGILDEMIKMNSNGTHAVYPTAQSFSIVIDAWARSNNIYKARMASSLLVEMEYYADEEKVKSLRPNVFVYATVLNACAQTFGNAEVKLEALNIAIETFQKLEVSSFTSPNHVAYAAFLKTCRKFMGKDDQRRIKLVERAVHKCIKDGQVGEYVLQQINLLHIPSFYSQIRNEFEPTNGPVTMQDIPVAWSRNVKESRKKKLTSS